MPKQITVYVRACLILEPLFILPYGVYLSYTSVYMLNFRVRVTKVGFIATLQLIAQIFTSFVSGFFEETKSIIYF